MPKCNILYNGLQLDTDLRFRPCGTFLRDDTTVAAGGVIWPEYVNGTFLKNVIKIQDEGWHPNCNACKMEEDLGLPSKRTSINKELSGIPGRLEYLDLSISNKCNLSCKMCSPAASTKWESLMPNNPELKKYYQFIEVDNRTVEQMLGGIDLTYVKKIMLKGGEPFLGNTFETVLEWIKKERKLEEIEIHCITNSTFFPHYHIEDLKKFKRLEINLSIDGLDEMCDYIRTGADWSRVSKVAEQWVDLYKNSTNMHINVGFTLQALNLHHYKKVKEWSEERGLYFYACMLSWPQPLSMYSVPQDYIDYLNKQDLLDDKLKGMLTGQKYPAKDLLEMLEIQDKAMGTSLKETVPALWTSLNKHR